jgi:hypothetical protein
MMMMMMDDHHIIILDGRERLASSPGLFTPTERAPNTHWLSGRGSRAGLDALGLVPLLGYQLQALGLSGRTDLRSAIALFLCSAV